MKIKGHGKKRIMTVLLPVIPAAVLALEKGNKSFFSGDLFVELYVLFLLTAVCSYDFPDIYRKLFSGRVLPVQQTEKLRFCFCCTGYHLLWCGFLFMIYLL